ncbi:MAG: preprotein translocase subunit SecG [Candidatus Kapaibacteriota bacterium]|jgi:protein translocase SecG subunit
MGYIIVSILMIILAAILILAVLLQPGKGDMLTSSSGLTNQFSSVLGAKKTMDMLSKVTIGIAITLFLLSVVTNKFLLNNGPANVQRAATEGMEMPANSAPVSTPIAPPANGGKK